MLWPHFHLAFLATVPSHTTRSASLRIGYCAAIWISARLVALAAQHYKLLINFRSAGKAETLLVTGKVNITVGTDHGPFTMAAC